MPEDQPDPPVIYVDTSVWGNLLLDNRDDELPDGTAKATAAKRLFDAIDDGRAILATSGLVKAELMCIGNYNPRDGKHQLAEGWFSAPSTRWADIDRFLAEDAIKYWRTYKDLRPGPRPMHGADATHLAAAVRLGAHYLMTTDTGFPIGQKVDGVEVCYPKIVWEATLLDQ